MREQQELLSYSPLLEGRAMESTLRPGVFEEIMRRVEGTTFAAAFDSLHADIALNPDYLPREFTVEVGSYENQRMISVDPPLPVEEFKALIEEAHLPASTFIKGDNIAILNPENGIPHTQATIEAHTFVSDEADTFITGFASKLAGVIRRKHRRSKVKTDTVIKPLTEDGTKIYTPGKHHRPDVVVASVTQTSPWSEFTPQDVL